jgi:glycosyltransferase involved in cell wall biosynthesis
MQRSGDLVFLGGDDPRKGAYDLLQVWSRLIDAGFAGRLHWYGRVSDEMRQLITPLTQSNRIEIHGHVPRSAVFSRLEQSAVLLMLSRAEACSIAVLESMSMECVPVAWDIEGTGTKEIIPEDYRFLAPLGNYDAYAHQVLGALAKRELFGAGLAQVARSGFTEQRMWARYQHLVADLLGQPRAVRPCAGTPPPHYAPPVRASYFLPRALWQRLRPHIAKSPRLYYFLRNRL